MKKRFWGILVALVLSACAVFALVACGEGGGNGGGGNLAPYVGYYVFVSTTDTNETTGESVTQRVGENGLTEESVTLELSENGTFEYVTRQGSEMTATGTWNVNKSDGVNYINLIGGNGVLISSLEWNKSESTLTMITHRGSFEMHEVVTVLAKKS